MGYVNNADAHGPIARGEDFTNSTGSLTGEYIPANRPPRVANMYALPVALQDRFYRDLTSGRIDYVVRSYGTPIAWRMRETQTLIVPPVTYSVTTTRHQGAARHASADRTYDDTVTTFRAWIGLPEPLTVGTRVKIDPSTDLFMRGETYAEVAKLGRKYVHVTGERSGRTFRLTPDRLMRAELSDWETQNAARTLDTLS